MKTLSGGCRLCGGQAHEVFDLRVLATHDVCYFRCDICGSLQTETPYWLNEAYSTKAPDQCADGGKSNLNFLDTGAVRRNLDCLGVTLTIANLFNCHDLIDIGGGDGLLCRLLRDHGINAFVRDNYAKPTYAQGFTEPTFVRPDIVSAFEVLEHFARPCDELDDLYRLRPRIVLVMTTPYSGQDHSWPYLIPITGQHIFFYSEMAFRWIADHYDYDLFRKGNYTVFFEKGLLTPAKRLMLDFRMRTRILRLYNIILSSRPAQGYLADAQLTAD